MKPQDKDARVWQLAEAPVSAGRVSCLTARRRSCLTAGRGLSKTGHYWHANAICSDVPLERGYILVQCRGKCSAALCRLLRSSRAAYDCSLLT